AAAGIDRRAGTGGKIGTMVEAALTGNGINPPTVGVGNGHPVGQRIQPPGRRRTARTAAALGAGVAIPPAGAGIIVIVGRSFFLPTGLLLGLERLGVLLLLLGNASR